MDIYTANPGPIDDSVLYDQEKHVSTAVWEGQERGALRCHEHTSKLDQWALTPKQLQLVSSAGFGYLRLIPAISLDNPLISALVERWRRETNTFHLNVGEMTVTLEDVAYLLGLAIEGEPVIGVTYTTCDKVCQKYLGKAPDRAYTSGGMVKLSWLKESFSQYPEDASNEEIERHTRAYLLYLLGSTIFSTTTGNKVPVMYLQLFEDFEKAGRYAWGAAALAFLYRALGNASTKTQSTISGCLTLLQCWSYYHLNIGRPKLNQDPVHDCFPLVLRWKGKQTGPTTNRDVGFYRKALDALKPSDVDWNPYQRMSHSVTPDDIRRYIDLGRSKTMLICFDKAERHLPDRCLRQFGKPQAIPEAVKRWERKSRGVDGGVDLSGKMENELNEWMDRWSKIVEGHVHAYVDESEYLHWYLNITRKFIGRPIPISSEFHKMNATLREIALLADTISTQGMDDHQIQSVTRIRYIAHECLRDQIGCSMVGSTSLPEEEPLRMGRGKERVRRKGMGRRKRKDDTDDNLDLSDSDQPKLCRVDDNVNLPMVHADYGDDNGQLYHLVSSHSCPPGNVDSVAMDVDSQFYHVVKEDNDLLLSHPTEHVSGSELCHEMMEDDPHPSQAANEGDLLSSEEATGSELQQLRSANEEEAEPSPLAIEDKVWPAPALFDANSQLSQTAIKGKSKIEMSHADVKTDSQPSEVINQNVSRHPQKGGENRSEQSREASKDQKFSDRVHELNTNVSGNIEAPLTSPESNEDPE